MHTDVNDYLVSVILNCFVFGDTSRVAYTPNYYIAFYLLIYFLINLFFFTFHIFVFILFKFIDAVL